LFFSEKEKGKMRIIFIRHGEDQEDPQHKHDELLNPKAVSKIRRKAVKMVSAHGLPRKIYTSPLRRTLSTAEQLAKAIKNHSQAHVSVEVNPNLTRLFSSDGKHNLSVESMANGAQVVSKREFEQRVRSGIDQILEEFGTEDVVVWCVTHARVIQEVHEIIGKPMDKKEKMRFLQTVSVVDQREKAEVKPRETVTTEMAPATPTPTIAFQEKFKPPYNQHEEFRKGAAKFKKVRKPKKSPRKPKREHQPQEHNRHPHHNQHNDPQYQHQTPHPHHQGFDYQSIQHKPGPHHQGFDYQSIQHRPGPHFQTSPHRGPHYHSSPQYQYQFAQPQGQHHAQRRSNHNQHQSHNQHQNQPQNHGYFAPQHQPSHHEFSRPQFHEPSYFPRTSQVSGAQPNPS